MFQQIKNLFSDPSVAVKHSATTVINTDVQKTAWRNNMWVVTPNGVGVLFQIGEPCLVHLVDPQTGVTIKEALYQSTKLRQARYLEIPECRRGDEDKAARLGYL